MFNLGSSYFHVALTTVRHLLTVTHRVSHRLKVTEAVQTATLLDPSTKDLMCSIPFDEQKTVG